MIDETSFNWEVPGMPPLEGDPFELVRSSCAHAVPVARDVSIDEATLRQFMARLDHGVVREILASPLGENCDTLPGDFRSAREAANFALLFCLLQFGHGFRHDLHRLCGRGASQTITLGVRSLCATGGLGATRLQTLTLTEIREAFQLPDDPVLAMFAQQLHGVASQAGRFLVERGMIDFAAFCQQILNTPEAKQLPAASLVRQLANHFPAFNDQGILHNGFRVVLLKKATLAIGELRRLAAPHDASYDFSPDGCRAVAPVDNVIPAVLVYHGVLRLSPAFHQAIHGQQVPLPRGPQEAELRAVALAACEQMVAIAAGAFTALDLGYYLWRSGKTPEVRQFARHHTKDTVFY